MALPAIAPYPMPSAHDLPDNRVDWTLEPGRAALLIHDMQEYFLEAFDRSRQPVPELIAHIAELRDRCHALGIPVIYSAQPPGQSVEQRGLLQDFWGPGIGTDPAEAAIVAELAPAPQDRRLTKWRYSAFVRTDLHSELRTQGRDQLMICGIYAHIGCLMTAAQAFMEEVQPFLVADAVADFSRLDHHMALDYAARRCAMTLTTRTALAQLGGSGRVGHSHDPQPQVDAQAVGSAVLGAFLSRANVRTALAALADDPLDDLTDDDDLSDSGIDSIRLMGLITAWQQAGFSVTFEELAEEPTIAAWTALLARRGTPVAR